LSLNLQQPLAQPELQPAAVTVAAVAVACSFSSVSAGMAGVAVAELEMAAESDAVAAVVSGMELSVAEFEQKQKQRLKSAETADSASHPLVAVLISQTSLHRKQHVPGFAGRREASDHAWLVQALMSQTRQ
jgi:hypothetical protein